MSIISDMNQSHSVDQTAQHGACSRSSSFRSVTQDLLPAGKLSAQFVKGLSSHSTGSAAHLFQVQHLNLVVIFQLFEASLCCHQLQSSVHQIGDFLIVLVKRGGHNSASADQTYQQ